MKIEILIIDEETSVYKLIRNIFRNRQNGMDYHFHYLSTIDEACIYLRQFKNGTDIVLLDINMPGQLNGMSFLEEINKINTFITTIIISSNQGPGHSQFAIQNGAFDFVPKPIEADCLRIAVKRAIDHVVAMKKMAKLISEVDTLKYFVNYDVINFLKYKSIGDAMKECKREIGTVLVTDIKEYTVKSRAMEVPLLLKLLNEYFTVITRSVYTYRGIIDKFIGDSAMAIFMGQDHLQNAVDASFRIRQQIAVMNKVRKINNEETFCVSMGISSGELIQGNIGSIDPVRLDHTFIGDTVNLGFRIQSIAGNDEILFIKNSHTELLLTAYTCKKFVITKVKGSDKDIEIYCIDKAI